MSSNACDQSIRHGFCVTLGRSLRVAALLLLSSIALSMLTPTYISQDWVHRLFMALMGCIVVAYANVIPKVLTPLTRVRCSPAQDQAMRRFAGWSLVLGGMGYTSAALFAPIALATVLACALLATSLLLVVLRCVWAIAGPRRG